MISWLHEIDVTNPETELLNPKRNQIIFVFFKQRVLNSQIIYYSRFNKLTLSELFTNPIFFGVFQRQLIFNKIFHRCKISNATNKISQNRFMKRAVRKYLFTSVHNGAVSTISSSLYFVRIFDVKIKNKTIKYQAIRNKFRHR